MARNPNGHGYVGPNPYDQPQGAFSPQSRYGSFVPPPLHQQHPLRRTPSFDAGDDRTSPNVGRQNQEGYMTNLGYRPSGRAGAQQGELFLATQSPVIRTHSGGNSPNTGLSYGSPSLSPNTRSYNPQEYAQTQPQWTQQAYNNSINSYNAGYQPYIPAAYHTTNPIQQPAYGYSAPVPPHVPAYNAPPPEQPLYGQRRTPSITQQPTVPSFRDSYRHAPLPQIPASSPPMPHYPVYTPPAPPPPPFSPSRDAFSSDIQPTAPARPFSYISSASVSPDLRSNNQRLPALPQSQGGIPYSPPSLSTQQSLSPRPSPNISLPSTPGPTPPQHSPQRTNTTGRHPQQRPLPGPPQASQGESDYFDHRNGEGYDANDEAYGHNDLNDIMKEVEAAVMGRVPSTSRPSPQTERTSYQDSTNERQEPRPLFSGIAQTDLTPDTNHTHTNGLAPMSSGLDINYGAYDDDSDAEASAGLAAMRMAEEQEAAAAARRHSSQTAIQSSYGSQRSTRPETQSTEPGSDSDVPIDIETFASSFPSQINYHYGNDSSGDSISRDSYSAHFQPSLAGSRRSNLSSEIPDIPGDSYFLDDDSIHPFPSFGARVDTGGTGGLAEPSSRPRRLSFEDGDEATFLDSDSLYADTSGAPSPGRDQSTRPTTYPSRTASRPLPQLPGLMTSGYMRQRLPTDQFGRPTYPQRPEEYDQVYSPAGMNPVQKSNSIGSHPSAPLVIPPGRSITDAEQRRRQQQSRSSTGYDSTYSNDAMSAATSKYGDLPLPQIPAGRRKKFVPSKLSSHDFKRCSEPWALGSILAWIREMTEGENDLKEHAIVDAIVALFTHKVPTMNTADAEVLSAQVVQGMLSAGAMIKEEEWVKLGNNDVSGVLFQLTGTGCYSPRLHTTTIQGRCYAHHCMRTLKKINLSTQPKPVRLDWLDFYKLKKESIENLPKKEVERQNILHEIVQSEDLFMDQLNVLTDLYRNGLLKSQQSIISSKRLDSFVRDVFGKVDAVKQANEDYLLAQLKYRQQEKGPWIPGFSDIFREWIRKAKTAYIEYAAAFPNATLLIRREAERNVLFRQYLDQVREQAASNRLGWDTYLKAPITRLQRYTLLLQTVYKATTQESAEKSNLHIAIEEIKAVTLDCDARVAEMSKRVDLSDLSNKLKLRPGMEKVQLNLTHLGREIIYRSDLQRKGTNKLSWIDIHAILFDHFLVLAKPLVQRDAVGGLKAEVLDVSKLPIPMDLLVLESANDEPVVKSSTKGIASVTTVTSKAQTPQERIGRTTSNQNTANGPGTLQHTNTNTSTMSSSTTDSGKTLVTTTVLDSPNDKVIYPFRVKHLGNTEYLLFASSPQIRQEWCEKIIEAKTRHAASLFAQNAEPFRLRVMADTAFAYSDTVFSPKSTVIKGTPLDRAIYEIETAFEGSQRPSPVCRTPVNCATTFNQPYGKKMIAVGTEYGVYMAEYGSPRAWFRTINALRVTQIAVLEEFSILLLISDKSLIAYHLDSVCPAGGLQNVASESSARRAPQKLSGARDVGFFATGKIKDRTLVFYKKKDGISSTFKVLEPVFQKSATTSRNRFGIRKGATEFFRDYDDFYIPSETYAINLFHTSLAIATARGFEVMTLDKKVPITIPDLKGPDVASIAARVREQKTLGMFRLTDDEFILVFDEVGIYVDKFGDVSRAVVMEFVGKARQAALYNGKYLILVDTGSGFVEVRNADNGRLRQVVSGKDVRLLDDGTNGGTVKICLQHPELERIQLVVELIVNEGLKE